MKLSEIFRRAAESLPQHYYEYMCEQVNREFFVTYQNELLKPEVDEYDFGKVAYRLAVKKDKILDRFRPKRARKYAPWVSIKNTNYVSGKNAIQVDTIEEAQAWRKDVLLKCAEIAESEGL